MEIGESLQIFKIIGLYGTFFDTVIAEKLEHAALKQLKQAILV